MLSFKYFGCVLAAYDYYLTSVVVSLQKNQNKWARLSRILGREGANMQVSGTLFKAVVQSVLLFRSKMCVMTPCMGRDGGGIIVGWPIIYKKSNTASLVQKLVLPPFGGIGTGGGDR